MPLLFGTACSKEFGAWQSIYINPRLNPELINQRIAPRSESRDAITSAHHIFKAFYQVFKGKIQVDRLGKIERVNCLQRHVVDYAKCTKTNPRRVEFITTNGQVVTCGGDQLDLDNRSG